MGNMSYCRFQNTVSDLRDCYNHMYDSDETEDLSKDEQEARKDLIKLCCDIAEQYGEKEGE